MLSFSGTVSQSLVRHTTRQRHSIFHWLKGTSQSWYAFVHSLEELNDEIWKLDKNNGAPHEHCFETPFAENNSWQHVTECHNRQHFEYMATVSFRLAAFIILYFSLKSLCQFQYIVNLGYRKGINLDVDVLQNYCQRKFTDLYFKVIKNLNQEELHQLQ